MTLFIHLSTKTFDLDWKEVLKNKELIEELTSTDAYKIKEIVISFSLKKLEGVLVEKFNNDVLELLDQKINERKEKINDIKEIDNKQINNNLEEISESNFIDFLRNKKLKTIIPKKINPLILEFIPKKKSKYHLILKNEKILN